MIVFLSDFGIYWVCYKVNKIFFVSFNNCKVFGCGELDFLVENSVMWFVLCVLCLVRF